ncbi:Transducin-like enhancer protein 3 [Massospora cicadina]|nr:Transducin-like enhancer protein 3 [Massospora cicadina]
MDRTRYNGKPLEGAAGISHLPPNMNNPERLVVRKFEAIRAELDLLQQLALNNAASSESGELGRKYAMFYEIAHSLYSHIQLQRDLSFNAIKLVTEVFNKVDDEMRAHYKAELQNLQSAYEDLAATGKALKPPSLPDFAAARHTEPHPPEPNSAGAKRPTALAGTPNFTTLNLKIRSRCSAQRAREWNRRKSLPAPSYEPKTYEQLQQLAQTQKQASMGCASKYKPSDVTRVDLHRRILSPSRVLGHPKQHFSSPMREPEHPKALYDVPSATGRTESFPELGRSLVEPPPKANPGLRTIHTLPHGDVVCSIASSGLDASLVYTGGLGSVKLWDTTKHSSAAALSLESMWSLKDNYIRACRISPDGKTLVVGGESDKIVLWDISMLVTPGSLACFVASSTAIYAMAFSPDSRILYTCCSGGEVLVWDLVARKRIRSLVGHNLGVTCVDITPDGRKLVTGKLHFYQLGGLDKTVRVWDLTTFTQISCCNLPSPIFSLGLGCFSTPFNENDAVVVAGAESSLISVLPFVELLRNHPKLAAGVETFPGHATCVISLKFSPDKRHFVSTGKEGLIMGWKLNPTSPALVRAFMHHETASVLACDISQDGKYLITGSGASHGPAPQKVFLSMHDSRSEAAFKL